MRVLTAWLAPACVTAIACGCSGPGISGDDYELVAEPPGLQHVEPMKTRVDQQRRIIELYRWTLQSVEWPKAQLIFARMKDIYRGNFTFARDPAKARTMYERINISFPSRNVQLQGSGRTRNALGPVDFQRFTVDEDAECTYIEQGMSRFSDQVELRSSAEPLGDMLVFGWYCAADGTASLAERFAAFIASIGIRGYAMP